MNPMQIIQMMMGNNQMMNNPMVRNAMGMMNSNDVNGLKSLAENLAKSKGVNIEDVQKQVMQRFNTK